MRPTDTLFDRVHEGLISGTRIMGIKGSRADGGVRQAMVRHMEEAVRFRLDDDFTIEAAMRCLAPPLQVRDLWDRIRLPYPRVWIEFSEEKRGQAQAALEKNLSPDLDIMRTGYLMEQHDDVIHVAVAFELLEENAAQRAAFSNDTNIEKVRRTVRANSIGLCLPGFRISRHPLADAAYPPASIKHIVLEAGAGQPTKAQIALGTLPMHTPLSNFCFDFRDLMDDFSQVALQYNSETMRIHKSVLSAAPQSRRLETLLLGRIWVWRHQEHSAAVIQELAMRTQVETTPWSSVLGQIYGSDPNEAWGGMMTAIESDPRFAATILGMLMTRTTETQPVHRMGSRSVKTPAGTRRDVPYPEIREVRLIAPSPQPAAPAGSQAQREEASRKREHDVRGTWCHRRTGLTNTQAMCAHFWIDETRDLRRQVCNKCGAYRWWRPQHKRGDPALGRVDKRYRVERGADDEAT